MKLFFTKKKEKWDTDPEADSYKGLNDFDVKKYSKEWKLIRNNIEWSSYTHWKFKPFSGDYINVNSKGNRNTLNPANKKGIHIVMLGGSTVWGVGVSDSHTIPSLLANSLFKHGVNAEVINLGQIGYITTQDVIEFMQYIKTNLRPDFVIFYNGMNDVLAAIENNKSGIPYGEMNRQKEFNILKNKMSLLSALFDLFPIKKNKFQVEYSIIDSLLIDYQYNFIFIEALRNRYNFSSLYYLQPTIFNKENLTEYEKRQQYYLEGSQPYINYFYSKVSEFFVSQKIENFIDLSDILKDFNSPCFVDCAHLSQEGNSLIANRISTDILNQIKTTNSLNKAKDIL